MEGGRRDLFVRVKEEDKQEGIGTRFRLRGVEEFQG